MSREKQIEEMADDLMACHTEFYDNAELYTDYDETAKEMYAKGYRKQSGWISVEERLPERAGAYLTYTFRGYTKISHFEEWVIGEEPSFDDYSVTHWMPLPEAPKMKGGE